MLACVPTIATLAIFYRHRCYDARKLASSVPQASPWAIVERKRSPYASPACHITTAVPASVPWHAGSHMESACARQLRQALLADDGARDARSRFASFGGPAFSPSRRLAPGALLLKCPPRGFSFGSPSDGISVRRALPKAFFYSGPSGLRAQQAGLAP